MGGGARGARRGQRIAAILPVAPAHGNLLGAPARAPVVDERRMAPETDEA